MLLQKKEHHKDSLVVGLDPSISSFGVVCLSTSGAVVYNWSVSSEADGLSDTKRILALYQSIVNDLGNIKDIAFACFEDYGPIGKFAGKVTQRAELCGLIKGYLLIDRAAPIIMVAPTSLKKYATGNGRATKDDMLSFAARHGFFPNSADEADAFFAAKLGYDVMRGAQPDCSYNRVNP